MAFRALTRFTITKQAFSRSYTSASISAKSIQPSSILRYRSLIALTDKIITQSSSAVRCFSTRQTTSSLQDSSPNWSNRPPKETILLDGCDFEHWLVVVDKFDENTPREHIIDSYIKTLAQIVGSEEEARKKIYSVSTKHYFAFGALVSEELSYKLKELPNVRWVLPDSYLDVRAKDYGGEPFVNGEAAPYDSKYHAEWVRNSQRANERNNKKDGGRRTNDRQRSYEPRTNNTRPPANGPPPPGFSGNTRPPGDFNNGPQQQQGGYNNGPQQQQGGYNNAPQQQGGYNNAPQQQGGYNRGQGNMGGRPMQQQERMGDANNPIRGNMNNMPPQPHGNFPGQHQQMQAQPQQEQWRNGGQSNYVNGQQQMHQPQPWNSGGPQMQAGYNGQQNGGHNFQQQRTPTPYAEQGYQNAPPSPPPMGGAPYAQQQNVAGRDHF